MGLFDTFWTTDKVTKCPSGHIQKDSSFQTKKFDCMLENYYLGDVIDPDIIEAKIWVYSYCKKCEKPFGRFIIIKDTKFADWTPIEWEQDDKRPHGRKDWYNGTG